MAQLPPPGGNPGQNADGVNYDNTTSGLSAGNVQEAIDELESTGGGSGIGGPDGVSADGAAIHFDGLTGSAAKEVTGGITGDVLTKQAAGGVAYDANAAGTGTSAAYGWTFSN